jgi:hypothetical protein
VQRTDPGTPRRDGALWCAARALRRLTTGLSKNGSGLLPYTYIILCATRLHNTFRAESRGERIDHADPADRRG